MPDAPDKIVIYPSKDGRPDIRLRVEDGTVWLSQAEIADLFGTSTANVNIHIKNILEDGELVADSVIKESLITAADGKNYRTKLYRLEMILSAHGSLATRRSNWQRSVRYCSSNSISASTAANTCSTRPTRGSAGNSRAQRPNLPKLATPTDVPSPISAATSTPARSGPSNRCRKSPTKSAPLESGSLKPRPTLANT